MANDRTRKIDAAKSGAPAFLSQFSITLVVLDGPAAGTEYEVTAARTVLGRGAEADWSFGDDSMSKAHAAIEIGATGVRVVDLDSTNGTFVNEERTQRSDLKHGDRIQLGESSFQCLLERRTQGPKTFQID